MAIVFYRVKSFQSPFSGDVDCETYVSFAIGAMGANIIFQSPFSGDVDCEELEWAVLRNNELFKAFNPRFQGISIVS